MAPGLRERKKARTRQALEAAALELFDTTGYDLTTVEQIAEAADVSTRTFFRYYPTKADVLLGDQQARTAMVREFLEVRPAAEPIMESLKALMTEIARELPAERHLLTAQTRWWGESDLLISAIRNHHAQLVDLLTAFVAGRLDTSDPLGARARAIATACIASLVAVTTDWIESGCVAELPDVQAAVDALESGLVVPG